MATCLGLTKSEFQNTYAVLDGILSTSVESIVKACYKGMIFNLLNMNIDLLARCRRGNI